MPAPRKELAGKHCSIILAAEIDILLQTSIQMRTVSFGARSAMTLARAPFHAAQACAAVMLHGFSGTAYTAT